MALERVGDGAREQSKKNLALNLNNSETECDVFGRTCFFNAIKVKGRQFWNIIVNQVKFNRFLHSNEHPLRISYSIFQFSAPIFKV